MKCISCLYEQEKPFKFCPECGAKSFDIVISSVSPVNVEQQKKVAGDKSQKDSKGYDEINSAAKIDGTVKSVNDNDATVPSKDTSTIKDDSQNSSEGNDELNSAVKIDGALKNVNDNDATVPSKDTSTIKDDSQNSSEGNDELNSAVKIDGALKNVNDNDATVPSKDTSTIKDDSQNSSEGNDELNSAAKIDGTVKSVNDNDATVPSKDTSTIKDDSQNSSEGNDELNSAVKIDGALKNVNDNDATVPSKDTSTIKDDSQNSSEGNDELNSAVKIDGALKNVNDNDATVPSKDTSTIKDDSQNSSEGNDELNSAVKIDGALKTVNDNDATIPFTSFPPKDPKYEDEGTNIDNVGSCTRKSDVCNENQTESKENIGNQLTDAYTFGILKDYVEHNCYADRNEYLNALEIKLPSVKTLLQCFENDIEELPEVLSDKVALLPNMLIQSRTLSTCRKYEGGFQRWRKWALMNGLEDGQIDTAMKTDNSPDSDQKNDNQDNVINNNHNMNNDSKLENERLNDYFPDELENRSGVTDNSVSGEAGNSNDNIQDVAEKNTYGDMKNGSDKDMSNEGKENPENNLNELKNANNSDVEGQGQDKKNNSDTPEMTHLVAEKSDVGKPSGSVQKKKDGSTEGEKGSKKSNQKNEKQDNAKKAQGTRKQTESARREKVNFHVLLSKEFQIDRKTDELFIRGEDNVLGGWNNNKHKMDKIRDFENFTEYRKTIMVDTNAMIKGFDYKYCLVNGQKHEFERVYHMIKKSGNNKEANRHLKVPKSLKDQTTGEWHQFDGFCYHKEVKGTWHWITGIFNSSELHQLLLKDLNTAAAHFLNPLIKTMLSTQKENILVVLELKEQVEMALRCIRLQSNGDKTYPDEKYFQEIMFILVIHPLLDHLKTCEKNNISLMLAIFVIILTNNFEMKLDIQYQHTIYRNLLVQVNMEEKKCLSSDFIAEKLEKKYICEQILMFMKKQRVVKDNVCVSSWFYAVPLVHFLSGHVHPFSKIPVDANHTKKEWWCFSEFEKMKDVFKISQWNKPLEDLLLELSHLFQVDYLLPRTIIASLNKEDVLAVIPLEIIPVEICCATLCFHIQDSNSSYRSVELVEKIENRLDSICKLIDKKAREKSSSNGKSTKMFKKITMDLIDAVLNDDRLFQHGFILLCTLYDYILNIDSENEDQELKEFGQKCEDIIHKKLYSCYYRYYGHKIWSTLDYSSKNQVKDILTQFHDVISLPIQKKLEPTWKPLYENMLTDFFSKASNKVCLEIYCEEQDIEKYCSCIQDFLSDKAFEEFNRALQTGHVYQYDTKRIGKLLSKAWAPFYATYQKNPAYLFDWIALKKYIEVFDGQKKSVFLTEECHEGLTMVISKIEDYFRRISKGDITRDEMLLITEKSDKVKTLFQSVIKNGNMDLIFNIRQKELSVLQDYFDQLQSMLNIARTVFKEDADRLSERFHELTRDSPDVALNTLYTTPVEFENIKLENYIPLINPLQIPNSLLNILPSVHTLQESQLFLYVWSTKAKQEENGTFFDKFESAWSNAEEEWKTFCKEFTSGIISFQKFEKYKSAVENDKHLMSELCKVVSDEELIKKRMKQYETFKTITTCQKASDVIMDIKDMLKISGDFSLCTKIISMGADESLAMKEIDELLLATVGKMKEIGEEKLKLLQSFRKSESLVKWLKETMKDGLKELKVFVDLAFISAGEGDLEIDRVNYFHTVTSAFAPLIFDLPAESDLEKFMVKCDVIFKEMVSDKKLSEKLLDTNRQLEWFKAVRQSHGSVEVTSLEQAEMIVSHGIYKINPPTSTSQNKLEVQTVLTLNVSNKDDKKAMVNDKYSFEKLMDLQSRLMLVAGQAEKGRARVEAFTSTLDGVVRLAKAYVKLCSDGCVFFNSWRAEFLCDNNKEICARLVFGKNHPLTGHRHHDNVEVFVSQVANFLEQCHEDWLSYLRQKRREYLVLNYYTVKQLVFLQQEIIKVGSDEPNKLIYPLLSLLKESCCEKDLSEAMKWAEEDVRTKDKEETRIIPAVSSDNEIELKFIDTMITNGFKRELALEAFNAVSDKENIDEGLSYCMDNASDIEESCIDEEDTLDTERFLGWSTGDGSIDNNIGQLLKDIPRSDRISCKDLVQNFKKIWKEFLKKVSSSVSDYLSLEHLGIILQKLAASECLSIRRNLPAGLSEGQPNLIVCPSDDMLNCLTYMYMHPGDQPLPKPDEVLICSKDTQFDEVDIFLRRAFYDSQNKIHCLAFADHLDYSVGDKCEKRLIEYVEENKGKSYKVVVFCTQENELKTKLVGALENYRSPPPKICTSPHIRSYLCEQFVSVKPNSASSVDFSRSTVRVIKSERAGVGKTLYKTRLVQKLTEKQGRNKDDCLTIPFFEKEVNVSDIADRLMEYTRDPGQIQPMIFHLDISSEVLDGVDFFLYNLLILGCIKNKNGYVWRKSEHDLYLIENIPVNKLQGEKKLNKTIHHMFEILPNVNCWSPSETLSILEGIVPKGYAKNDSLFDETEFRKEIFQRPFQYLESLDRNTQLEIYKAPVESSSESLVSCLAVLLRHCGIEDPSWAEIHHFALFLNTQLKDWETSTFCSAHVAEDFPGFAKFVLLFSIEMSRDFATRSLKMSEETPLQKLKSKDDNNDESELTQFQIKRHWESSPHPYIFFNPDHHTMTFLGFNVDRNTGDLVDQQNGQIIKPNLMPKDLYDSLIRNRAPLNENFQRLPRLEAISKLCCVMGIDSLYDPDPTYELTPDNAKKILAIYMRFRCNIPVIIMGETGCGKTRLVKFMCSLQRPVGTEVQNMILMKVHGGTTSQNVIDKVNEATEIATDNAREFGDNFYTVLFFDEANTTESIGLIKEIMCDGTMNGKKFNQYKTLKIVAACNPYRKHTDELIKRLENAGLGYHVDADATTDRMGRLPMRRLVYRVKPLPASMLPLVWDFGQLNTTVENLYIQQMVQRAIDEGELDDIPGLKDTLGSVLVACQDFMRSQKNECSFVSLRDVERVLSVMCWLLEQAKEVDLFRKITDDEDEDDDDNDEDEDEDYEDAEEEMVNDITIALILALAVCYRSGLRSREEFDNYVIQTFKPPLYLSDGIKEYQKIIDRCQECFLEDVDLGTNIAKNHALKENVFLMVVCMELRIPLFLVGKPGSSKSLAKTIVADAMQGNSSRSEFFKNFKQTHMVSFQCSPLSTADGILSTFTQCAKIQKDKNLDNFVATVVLDEIGLAEDSSKMPLKTLHPLLEDGCQGNEKPEPYMKVGFIGISNWALDPAKMNRGISVQREIPDNEELMNTADGICSSSTVIHQRIIPVLKDLAQSYLKIFEKAREKREFFGLRDFYSLVKMVYGFAEKTEKTLCWHQLEHCIKRNFGGLDSIDAVKVFKENLKNVRTDEKPHENDPDCSALGLIEAGLFGDSSQSENRYMLLLTENYGALGILQEQILQKRRVQTIFGSSFPRDQEYTQVCRNINRIKVCMETGNTVILLNLENLYESLYDALNQYYAKLGGERYVDLGLGSHRVKCRVHKNFRLIVVAEKKIVYEKFPIPLINRLEKHFLTLDNIMTKEQAKVTERLKDWASKLSQNKARYPLRNKEKVKIEEAFMGYHSDAAAAIVLKLWNDQDTQKVFDECKKELLWCSTPEAVLQAENSPLSAEKDSLSQAYFHEQQHGDVFSYIIPRIQSSEPLFAQITTHSTLLTDEERRRFDLPLQNVLLLNLQSFDTEQQFCQQIKNFVQYSADGSRILIIQSDSHGSTTSLVKSAQYCVDDNLPKDLKNYHVIFIVQLDRMTQQQFTGYQGGKWHCLHIDDLHPSSIMGADLMQMKSKSVAVLFKRERDIQESFDEKMAASPSSDSGLEIESINISIDDSEKHCDYLTDEYFHSKVVACIQAAVGRVKDSNDTLSRPTQRVSILISLLKDDRSEFSKGIRSIISRLLLEKENERGGSQLASRWLVEEVCKSNKIHKTGTFRRAVGQYFEEKITPILAGIVAVLDKNFNLDIIKQAEGWKLKLWLEILAKNNLLDLKYLDFISREQSEVLNEFVVNNTGYGQSCFQSCFPFSWLYINLIDKTLTTLDCKLEELDDDIIRASMIICDQELITVLINLKITDEMKEDMYICYIRDFIQMKYSNINEHIQKVIFELLTTALRQCEYHVEEMEIYEIMVAVHFVFTLTRIRIHQFLEIVYIYPDVINIILQQMEKGGGNPLLNNRQMTFDVMALSILLESLEPEREQLSQPKGKREWYERACKYLTVTEKILDSSEEQNGLEYSPICREFLLRIRCLWTRIMTIKLFLEHFPSGTSKKTDQSIRWQVLWSQLTENADLHKIECLQKVEKFLKMINNTVLKKLLGEIGKCSMCGNTLESSPIQLPCQHNVCDSCFDDIKSNEYQVCPECQLAIPEHFDAQAQRSDDNPTQKEIRNFQGNCNSFLMALVSKLCFTSNQAPEPAVIEKLMEYIAIQITPGGKSNRRIQTKPMSVFTNVIDPTPVCRLFLLKLLTKKSFDVVKSYLEKYFEFTQVVIEQEKNVQKKQLFMEFCFLVCQCLEDMLYEKSLEDKSQDEIQLATQYLDIAAWHIQDTCDVTEKLNHISKCRFGLEIVAKYLNMFCKTKRMLKADTKRLFNAAENILKIQSDWLWPKKYLVKQICRMYGTDVYAELMEDEQFKWVGFVNKEPLVQDRYIIYGDNYLNIRKELTLVDMGSNINQLEKLKKVKADWEIMFVMAVLSKVSTFQDKTSTFEKLKPFMEKNMKKKDMKELAISVVSSEDGSSPLFSVRCTNIVETKNIEYLLCHWLLVLRSTPDNTILQPLVNLALHITTMKDSFLPTMPEEDRGNLNLLLAVLKQREGTSAVYRCPNGHPYVIGDCGRPYTVSKCNECGQDIGGTSHNSLRNNQLDSRSADSTRKGHILGSANQRSKISTPERSLSPVMCSIIRLLTHMSLYLSSKTNEQDVKRLVEQKYVTGSIQEFFLQHIQKDIGVLHHALNKSSDDILLLMNILCKHVLLQLPLGEINDRNMIILNTKEARSKWEIKMSAALTPVVRDLEALLENGNSDILTSSNSGADELLAIVYEIDGDEDIDLNNLQYNGKIWSYRERITVEHFFRKFQLQIIDKENEGQSFKIIRLFKQELYHLQVQRFLPSIIKLLHSLMQKFSRKIDRREASAISVEDVFKKEFTDNEEIQEHFDNFVQAWIILNEKLISHVCRIDGNIPLTLPSEFHNMKLDLKSSLALFLPSTKGPGVCSYILVDFLCRKHNEFLQSCCFLKKQEHKFEDITAVHSKDLTSFHLFSFHLVKDIQPLVLSNCRYSLDLQSKRSEISYDFHSFENHLLDRILSRKSRILTDGPLIPMETMLFKADSSNALVFTSIRNHIPQIDISSVVKRQITEELHQKLPNICDSINNLDVTTSFLKSLGGDPDMNIHTFMSDTLKMNTSITSATARSECKLKQIQSLWLIFSFEKEKILTLRNKDPFVDFEEGLNVKMTDQDKVLIEEECKKIPIDKLEVMLYFIYDNILLKIAQPEVEYREMKLRELLYVELENCSNFVDTPSEYDKIDGDIFMTWPETVLGVHAIQVWITILQVFTKKDEEYFG